MRCNERVLRDGMWPTGRRDATRWAAERRHALRVRRHPPKHAQQPHGALPRFATKPQEGMGTSRKRRRRDGSGALLEVGVYRVRGGANEPLAGIRVVRTSDEALVAVALVAVDGQLTESDGGCEDGGCEDGRCFGLRGRRFVASGRGSIEEVGRDARWDLVGDFDAALYFRAGRDEAAFAACVRARGVAVLRGALSPEDVRAATDGCWSWIERASRWRRRDPASWADPRGDFS